MERNLIDWLHREAPPRVIYDHTPLALALCQVRFSRKHRLSNEGAIAPFQEAIEEVYPDPRQSVAQPTDILLSGPGAASSLQVGAASPMWQFSDPDENWTVTLTPDFVTLETRAYEHFGDFLDRLTFVLEALVQTVSPTLCRRIGLRYIDELRSPEKDWSSMIRPELLGVVQIEPFREACEQSMSVMSLRAEGAQIGLQHGVFPKGTTVVPKRGMAAGSDPFYLLDIDVYQEFEGDRALAMNAARICDHVRQYHDTVSEFFRWATTEAYRASLGERDDAGEPTR